MCCGGIICNKSALIENKWRFSPKKLEVFLKNAYIYIKKKAVKCLKTTRLFQ